MPSAYDPDDNCARSRAVLAGSTSRAFWSTSSSSSWAHRQAEAHARSPLAELRRTGAWFPIPAMLEVTDQSGPRAARARPSRCQIEAPDSKWIDVTSDDTSGHWIPTRGQLDRFLRAPYEAEVRCDRGACRRSARQGGLVEGARISVTVSVHRGTKCPAVKRLGGPQATHSRITASP